MLSDEQINAIEENIKNIDKKYPEFNLNRQKDMQTGENQHVIETDLIVSKKQDIDLERILQSWRGSRSKGRHRASVSECEGESRC